MKFKSVTAFHLDFPWLNSHSDEVIARFAMQQAFSGKRPLLPRKLRFHSLRVLRQPQRITIEFLLDHPQSTHVVAEFSIVPGPDFSNRPVMV